MEPMPIRMNNEKTDESYRILFVIFVVLVVIFLVAVISIEISLLPNVGGCCLNQQCYVTSELNCTTINGLFYKNLSCNSSCFANVKQELNKCCCALTATDGYILTNASQSECKNANIFISNLNECNQITCNNLGGGCCTNGNYNFDREVSCSNNNGVYFGNGTFNKNNNCSNLILPCCTNFGCVAMKQSACHTLYGKTSVPVLNSYNPTPYPVPPPGFVGTVYPCLDASICPAT